MAEVRQLLPDPRSRAADDIVGDLRRAQHDLTPFDHAVVAFAADFSRQLRRHPDVKAMPALGALAYWIRPASIDRLATEWQALCALDPAVRRVPQGVVFHIPPTNVDTLFVYSWLLSALCGNANVIRLSASATEGSGPLLPVLGEVLAEHPAVAATTAVVTYGHEATITGAFSRADVRVVWGGDETVAAIRAIPAAPHTVDITFPDRYSLTLLDARAVVDLDDTGLADLAQRFFNDAYWFDQLGCASPRLIVWHGTDTDGSAASDRFRQALGDELARRAHPETPTSAVVAKLVHATDTAAAGAVHQIDWANNSMTVASLTRLQPLHRDSPGGGLFYEATSEDLSELVDFVERKDQTLTHFGVPTETVHGLVDQLGARGIDRVVPVGEALTFGRYWDGHDLLAAFTRAVAVAT